MYLKEPEDVFQFKHWFDLGIEFRLANETL